MNNSVQSDYIDQFPPKVALGMLLTEKAKRMAENRLKYYSPYPKQVDFHTAGSDPAIRERLLIAGNQCITPWTFVDTGVSTLPAGGLVGGKSGHVRSWDGERECNARTRGWFLKSIEPAYRIVLDTGLWFDCTAEHQVMTDEGWTHISHLVSRADGLHYWQKREDYQANCVEDGYLCGQQLPTGVGSDQDELRTSTDVRAHTLLWGSEDALERIQGCNHAYQVYDLQTIADGDVMQTSALFAQFQAAKCDTPFLPLKGGTLKFQMFVAELGGQIQSVGAKEFDPMTCLGQLQRSEYSGVADRLGQCTWRRPSDEPFLFSQCFERSIQEAAADVDQVSIFYPYNLRIGERFIVAVVPLGYQPIIDVQVENTNCYKAAGIFHHNCGKTIAGSFEAAMHLTGIYPSWWKGAEFDAPTSAWGASETSQGTRDTVQRLLLGKVGEWGTGAIPASKILEIKRSTHGVADAVETILVQHVNGGTSRITLKTYDQGRLRWQGETLDFVWFDEEPPEDIYFEGLTRTNATNGIVWVTLTPLKGMSIVVKRFLIDRHVGTHVTAMTVHDAKHYTSEQIVAIIASYPEHERKSRSMGIPTLGSGLIFPVDEASIKCQAIAIPAHWVQIGGLDFGWDHPSAAVKLAWDRDSDIIYVTAAHRQSEQTPVLFSATIKPWGAWLPWAWPHDGLQHDKGSGETLANQYREQGLKMLKDKATHAPSKNEPEGTGGNGVEAGILDMLDRMQTGRLKVFEHLNEWFEEFRMYHRKDGRIVKEDDDLLCLHPDTQVMTASGLRRIEDLVGTSGDVVSIGGKVVPYMNCRMTRKNAEMVKVVFDDGFELLCTPDHKLLSLHGEWIKAVDSEGYKIHNAISSSERHLWKKSGLKVSGSPSLGNIGVVRESSCTAQFGSQLMDQFQKAITFITLMATATTTIFQTLSASLHWNTCLDITLDTHAGQTQQSKLVWSGDRQMKAKPLCLQWAGEIKSLCGKKLNSFVSVAAPNLSHRKPEGTGSVATSANQSGGGIQALIWSKRFALFAGLHTELTNTGQGKRAHFRADESYGFQHLKARSISKVLQVRSAGRSDVYCMEVPSFHAFAVGNGAIVHNCATRYALMMKRFAVVNMAQKPRRTGAVYEPHDRGINL